MSDKSAPKIKKHLDPKVKTTINLGFLAVGLVLAIVLFVYLRSFIACFSVLELPGIPVPGCSNAQTGAATPTRPAVTGEGTALPANTPVIATPVPTLAAPEDNKITPWDGASRINLLFIGLDYRDWEAGQGTPRSDTMIVFTIDPVSKSVGMLSIPRDAWINIPGGFGYGKINMAYMYGEQYKLPGENGKPGGGPGLAMKAVEAFIGIQVQYYAQVDFQTFEQMIDEIGGIDVDVPTKIEIDPIGENNTTILRPGINHLNGSLALAYARARHTKGGDVDRSYRQQQVIMAVLSKGLDPQNFPSLLSNAGDLYQQFSSGIHTNLGFDDAIKLALLMKDISMKNIKRGVMDYKVAPPGKVTVQGQIWDIVRPIPDRIALLRDEIFGGGALSPLASGSLEQLMKAEGASVTVLNGSGVEGLAGKTGDYLRSLGINVAAVGNGNYTTRTMIIDHSGKPYMVRFLMALMKVLPNQLQIKFDPSAQGNVEIIIGVDWANSNPMP
jgi:polyisoprenyl-teichoic acid--peptidoglycan teichoic acid transferase